ncbi:glycosyltransferase [Nibribacter koreensis]|uniref:Glycosyltransferase, catalytic subunit of cellulose synthase and poly-beta-1,6-N-acetylglucosamine synthase n=1 Tax=Nibribacter koreensis TaxID=1084519 RepID=A0ABP8FBG6_9BACT
MVISLVYFTLFFLLFLVLLYFWVFRFKGGNLSAFDLQNWPKVSILVAARDEESYILTCLEALSQLDYPKDKLEILVGDDRSQDQTKHLVKNFILDKPFIKLVSITHDVAGTKGKANVLAQLAHLATSNYYFFTDADIQVPKTWVKSLLQQLTGRYALATGITTVTGSRWFDRMQALDWLYSLGLMQVVADRGLPVSTMGNNMAITRQAYEAVGGFEGIPFSITEDVQLFSKVLKKGFSSCHVFSDSVLALSAPAPSLRFLLHQRKRWMRGAWLLPWYIRALLVFNSIYYPVWVPFFSYTSLSTALLIGLGKVLLQSIFVMKAVQRAGRSMRWYDVLFFEFYLLGISILLIVYYFLPFKINWKGRLY